MRYNEIKLDSQYTGFKAKLKAIWAILFNFKFVLVTITKQDTPQGKATHLNALALNTTSDDLYNTSEYIYSESKHFEQQDLIFQAYEILYPD